MTNRRNFFSMLGKVAVGFTILPSAATYTRQWKRTEQLWIPNPDWVSAEYEVFWFNSAPLFTTFHKQYLNAANGLV